MKSLKQKGEEFSKYEESIETLLVDKLLYNPITRKRLDKKNAKGIYYKKARWIVPIFERLTKARFSDYNLYFIAQSHLDASWLFPVVDAKIRAYKTFYKAIYHIEKYPEFFTFAQTSPQYYDWIKHYDPSLWQKVKYYVKKGRFEPVGGMWIEPTLDECWGESLVRQRLYGQLFYLREFGKISKVESLLDVFGFPNSLPQILKKSGAEAFWTTKCTWNDQNKWPIANYYWRGVDGTEIFTHHWKFQYMALLDLKSYKKTARFPKPEYNHKVLDSSFSNKEIEGCLSDKPDDRLKTLGIFYGWGDGARGPHEIEIMIHKSLAEMGYGKFTTMHKYFDLLKREIGDRYLIWNDEMYLEYHRGCKTTQLEIKHYNRRAELASFAVETFLTLIAIILKSIPEGSIPEWLRYNKGQLFEIWRRVLFNQFHDILPGSSIPDVYKLAVKEQKEAYFEAKNLILSALLKIAINLKIIAPDNENFKDGFLVFNPFPWERTEFIEYNNKLYKLKEIPPSGFTFIPYSESLLGDNLLEENIGDNSDERADKKEVAGDLPEKIGKYLKENESAYILENKYLVAYISKEKGTLTELYYKPAQGHIITRRKTYNLEGSGLRIYRENEVLFDAWNIDPQYCKHFVDKRLLKKPIAREYKSGIVSVLSEFKFLKSTASVEYILYPEDEGLRIKIHTSIKDPKIMVKYFIPVPFSSDKVCSETPYAYIYRRRIPKSEMERAKWEMNMQKWVDISDKDYGLSIINDNRYGFNATSRGIYITLVRSAKYPKPGFYSTYRVIPKKDRPKYTDLKDFDYNLYLRPHLGNVKDAKPWIYAYNFNLPLSETSFSTESIDLSGERFNKQISEAIKPIKDFWGESFLKIDNPNIILGALKLPEFVGDDLNELVENRDWKWNKKHIILRIVEQSGTDCTAEILFNPHLKIRKIEEVDLLEMNPAKELKVNGKNNAVKLPFHKFEIKTLRIELD